MKGILIMPRYLKVLLDESRTTTNNGEYENGISYVELFKKKFRKSIIFHYHVINTTSHLFIIKRIVNNKKELYEKLISYGIFPLDVGNTKCNVPEKMYNVYFQSGSRIIVNNLNVIKK